MKIKRIVFVNRAPFNNLDLNFSSKQVISLTGINGSGKTTILSYIVDAFYEIARKSFHNEFSGKKEGKLYRVSSNIYTMSNASNSLVYIMFDLDGKDIHYIDLLGRIDEDGFINLMSNVWNDISISEWPIRFEAIKDQLQHESQYAKYVTSNDSESKKAFSNGLLTYFPSYRFEQPGYLNDIYRMELSYRYTSGFTGFLTNPIEVTTDLPQIANWMMDVILDDRLYGNNDTLRDLQILTSTILSYKHKNAVRLGIGPRNMGGTRIQIVDSVSKSTVYPSIFNISAGESSLLCIFGELLRQADRLGRLPRNIEGIVLVDEVDKHLHISLQKEVIPILVQMFPNIQFLFTTHSAFVNIGLSDSFRNNYSIIDLDNNGIECDASENNPFREAYDAMFEENQRYLYFYQSLSSRIDSITKPIVYLGGRTDEKYFKKALEIYGYDLDLIDLQWIGHLDESGQEVFSGDGSLKNGLQFIKGRKPVTLHFFVFDCDAKRDEFDEDNIVAITIPHYDNHKIMNKGIENALELDGIDLESFYNEHTHNGDYGQITKIKDFEKMKMCDYICKLDIDSQKRILSNLIPIINKIYERVQQQNAD